LGHPASWFLYQFLVGILIYTDPAPFLILTYAQLLASTWASEVISTSIIPTKIAWNLGVQKRVSAISAMLNQMKGIKVMGLDPTFAEKNPGTTKGRNQAIAEIPNVCDVVVCFRYAKCIYTVSEIVRR
jgi:hypothetical protein